MTMPSVIHLRVAIMVRRSRLRKAHYISQWPKRYIMCREGEDVINARAGEELLAVRRECAPQLSVRPGGPSFLRCGAAGVYRLELKPLAATRPAISLYAARIENVHHLSRTVGQHTPRSGVIPVETYPVEPGTRKGLK